MARVPSSVFFKLVRFVEDVCRYAAAAWVTQSVLVALAGPATDGKLGGGVGGGVGSGNGGLAEAMADAVGNGDGPIGGDAGSTAASEGAQAIASMRWVMVTLPFGQIVKQAWRAVLGLVSAILAMVPAEWAQDTAERLSEAGLDLSLSKVGWCSGSLLTRFHARLAITTPQTTPNHIFS